jgi:hypothetical protein
MHQSNKRFDSIHYCNVFDYGSNKALAVARCGECYGVVQQYKNNNNNHNQPSYASSLYWSVTRCNVCIISLEHLWAVVRTKLIPPPAAASPRPLARS